MRHLPTLLLVLALAGTPLLAAEAPNAAEQKLRENLRATMLQLRTAESERAALQASQAESDATAKAATEKLEAMTRESAASQVLADKTVGDLQNRLARRELDLAETKAGFEKAKAEIARITEIARKKEEERARLAIKSVELQRLVTDRETKNVALFKTGTEILTRYERMSLGEALVAREPFTGITKVRLQNLVQDYQDKLLDQKVKP